LKTTAREPPRRAPARERPRRWTSDTRTPSGRSGDSSSTPADLAPPRPGAEHATRGGAEAFVDAADIAAVAVETLVDPDAHAGAQYAPTGPQSLTVSEVADIIADVIGRPVTHYDIDADAWIGGAIAAGFVPADYAVMLRWLTGTIISGNGSRPNDDIEKVTGRPPTTFQDFARRNAHAWTLQVAK